MMLASITSATILVICHRSCHGFLACPSIAMAILLLLQLLTVGMLLDESGLRRLQWR